MTITQPAAVTHYLHKNDPYKCSCGDTFGGLALLKTHLDLLRDDDGTHVERERVHHYRTKFRMCSCDFYVCSCGTAFAAATALDDHLAEFSDDGNHGKLPFDLNRHVRFGIRRIRIERGLFMSEIADLLGVNISAVSRIESGKRHAVGWGRTSRTVATLLGVDIRELLRVCQHCGYRPPDGYTCDWCGMPGEVLQQHDPGEADRIASALRAVEDGTAVICEISASEL
jgi:transcriptional regulator with XRE-family HTH domain